MTTEHVRRGGLEVWSPSKMPPIGVDLTDEQQLAIAFRHLAEVGFAENMPATSPGSPMARPTCTSTRGVCGGRS